MKTRYFLLLAATVLLASCQKEFQTPEIVISKGVTTLEVGLPDTKTYLGDAVEGVHKVYWSNGDQIAVNGEPSVALSGLPDNASSAVFTFNAVLTPPYNILYPSSIYTDATHVTLPSVQTYEAGGFDDGMFPMAGYSESAVGGIRLSHLCALVKISIKRAASNPDTDDIVSVRFMGKNSEKVSGNFEINYATPALTVATGTGSELEVRVAQRLSTESTAVYYLVVPARTYENGFDIIATDINGDVMVQSKASSWTAVAGKQHNMPAFDFVPTGTEVEIANAEQLIAFAKDYNDKVYSGKSPFTVTLTDNITFVDSADSEDEGSWAAFNATGGIGKKDNLFGASEDYYFNGIFNGGSFTISGLKATVPIFAAVGEDGHVSNFTIADDCTFTFTHPNTAELDAGAVVGYHKGELKGVEVEADVALAAGEISKVTALGGLVGRVTVGNIDNCTYSGNLSVPDGFAVTTQKTYIGGLVGSMTNADGKVQDSDFEGTIDFAGTVASTDKNNPYLMIGGIVGAINAGTLTDCSASDASTKAITMDNDNSYTATIQNHSRMVYHLAQGGIAGYNAGTVSGCTNDASVKNFVLTTGTKGGTASDSNSRYYDFGGIVGLNASGATVTGCINNGLFESRSTPRIQKIGGVVGYNKGTVSSSSNSASGTIYITTTNISPYSVRVGEVGGAIGNNEGTVTDVQNAGDISMDRTENAAGVELKFGGVIGLTTAAIDGGVGKNISNSGNISTSYNGTTVTTVGIRYGGIVGSTQASIQNVTNSGNVTYTLSAANVTSKLYMGGIAGEVRNTANVTVNGCENSGEVYFNVNAKAAAHTGDYIGGIIGFVTGEDIETTVSNCENTGYVHINCNIATACTDLIAAGIVGKMNESGSITNCDNVGGASNAGEVYIAFSDAAHTGNYAGGILGKTVNSDLAISGCTNSGYIHGGNGNKKHNGSTMFVGGIAAYLDGVSSVDDCENNGVLLNDQFNNTVTKAGSTFEGGIVGFALGTLSDRISITNVTNDVSDGGTITGPRRGYGGGVVGYGEYVDIDNANNTNSYNSGAFYNVGGIAGWLVNGTITGSTMSGTAISSSQMQKGGGIVAVLGADSTVDDCESHVASFSHTDTTAGATIVAGAIAGTSVAGATIQNCHYPASGTITNSSSGASPSNWAMAICSDSNFTDGGGNAADL